MARKLAAEDVQRRILTQSRRRCCLCFWLDGKDEVQRGQIAHIDQDNENPDEDNLVFLCLDHHDQYDGQTSQSKGLKSEEARHWRSELYREMEYRFRTVKPRTFKLTHVGFWFNEGWAGVGVQLRLTNTGETSARSPAVAIQLQDGITVDSGKQLMEMPGGGAFMTRSLDPFAMTEKQANFFEPSGRVAIQELGGSNPVLLAGHSWDFDGLVFGLTLLSTMKKFTLQYRVDAENCPPFLGTATITFPNDPNGYFETPPE